MKKRHEAPALVTQKASLINNCQCMFVFANTVHRTIGIKIEWPIQSQYGRPQVRV
jgi:hypothetical protein